MNKDNIVIVLLIGGAFLSIILFVRKKDIRMFLYAVLVAQLITGPVGLMLTLFKAVEYPVRLFPKAISSSFLHGFLLNPTMYAFYYLKLPRRTKPIRIWIYTLLITIFPSIIEYLESKYTNLIHYKSWNSFNTWIISLTAYLLITKYLDWFFKRAPKEGESVNED